MEIYQYLQSLQKKYPDTDLNDLSRLSRSGKASALPALQPRTSFASRRSSRASSVASLERPTPGNILMRSRTDLSNGLVSVDRGFDFATEEHGVEMRRVQTNLSERRSNKRDSTTIPTKGKDTISNVLSLPRSFLRKQLSQHKTPE